MSAGIKVSREEHTAEALRVVAGRSRDGEQVRRLLAIALSLEGFSRSEAARQCGMDRHRRCVTGCIATMSQGLWA
jgi:hypothetical protein